MSCSPYDLKDFLFGELNEADRRRVREHVEGCEPCRAELERLRLTHTALHVLRDEEVPRRIALVSDKVFEPRWWQRLWQSAPRLAFASAALLAGAIVFHAAYRPAPATTLDAAAIEARISAEVAKRLPPALEAAVAAVEARQARKTEELVAAARKDLEMDRRADRVAFAETLNILEKRNSQLYVASNSLGGRP